MEEGRVEPYDFPNEERIRSVCEELNVNLTTSTIKEPSRAEVDDVFAFKSRRNFETSVGRPSPVPGTYAIISIFESSSSSDAF